MLKQLLLLVVTYNRRYAQRAVLIRIVRWHHCMMNRTRSNADNSNHVTAIRMNCTTSRLVNGFVLKTRKGNFCYR